MKRSSLHRRAIVAPTRHAGVSLIEVLVAILVVALGILAMVAMQANATKLTKTSEIRTMGAMLVSDLADRMRANRAGFIAGSYVLNGQYASSGAVTLPTQSDAELCNGPTKSCSSADMAKADLADWLLAVNRALPNGTARVSDVDKSNNSVDVWLAWLETKEAYGKDRNEHECPSGMVTASSDPSVSAVTPRCMYFHINL